MSDENPEFAEPSPERRRPLVVAASVPAWHARPTFVFFGVVSTISLALDVVTKAWAEITLTREPPKLIVDDHLTFTLAYNRGGAWGLLQDASESLRRPFFLIVSILAIAFIVSLYGRLTRRQWALKWGLPFVLGGALGNLSDRITRGSVIDFIDYRADWVGSMNRMIAKGYSSWGLTDHWPTFNVADVSICIGVGLMAVDMMTSHQPHAHDDSSPPRAAELPPTSPNSDSAST